MCDFGGRIIYSFNNCYRIITAIVDDIPLSFQFAKLSLNCTFLLEDFMVSINYKGLIAFNIKSQVLMF